MNTKSKYTRSGTRRLGDDYQDLVAVETLIDWLEHEKKYLWVKVEADTVGSLDDVVAELADGTIVVRQVKFSTDTENPNDPWKWSDLLENTSSTTPLLKKWAESLRTCQGLSANVDAAVVTNRILSGELKACLSPIQTNFISYDLIADEVVRNRIIAVVGSETLARDFFSRFAFYSNERGRQELEEGLRRRFEKLGGDDLGWYQLIDEVLEWASHKDQPRLGGRILLADVKRAALWIQLKGLPQRFNIPPDYVPPHDFDEEFVNLIKSTRAKCLVITGTPGVGKSTYISHLYDRLNDEQVPVVRHHYFLSQSDGNSYDRLDHAIAAQSIMHDLELEHADALSGESSHNSNASSLRDWIARCASYYAAHGKPLVVLIDGLDHVWREHRSIEQLNRLMRHLLPTPEGVVVVLAMQPVDESQLPSCVRRAAPRQEWRQLPLLDSESVSTWIRLYLNNPPNDNEMPEQAVRELVTAFMNKCGGHPLQLQYAVRALRERGSPLTAQNVSNLPGCFHSDIVAYYQDLWVALDTGGKEILHLLSACPFPWPKDGILTCLDPTAEKLAQVSTSLTQVAHMLSNEALGLVGFHSSLLSFVRQLPEHTVLADAFRRKAAIWLSEKAPEHWKWSYEWRMRYSIGEPSALMNGPSRSWLVAAIASKRQHVDVTQIIAESASYAVEQGDLARAIELGVCADYASTAYSHYTPELSLLSFSQLRLDSDDMVFRRMVSGIQGLPSRELYLLAEAANVREQNEVVDRCLDELVTRTTYERHLDMYSHDEISMLNASLMGAVAFSDTIETSRVVDFVVRHRDGGDSQFVLGEYVATLRRSCQVDSLRTLFACVKERVDLGAQSFTKEELQVLARNASLLSIEAGVDLSRELAWRELSTQPFAVIHRTLEGSGEVADELTFPATTDLTIEKYMLSDRSAFITELFSQIFFTALANSINSHQNANKIWIRQLDASEWQSSFAKHLVTIANELGDQLRGGTTPTLAWLLNRFDQFERPTWPNTKDRARLQYSKYAAAACLAITFDTFVIGKAVEQKSAISPLDIATLFDAQYCSARDWVSKCVEWRQVILDPDALLLLVSSMEAGIDGCVEEMRERAERYADLAAIATLHGDSEAARRLVQKAANNLIAHSGHKDRLLFEAVDSVVACSETDNASARSLMLQVSQPICSVDLFTDGDETNHLPRELSFALAKIARDTLPSYYKWLCTMNRYDDASSAFEAYLQSADLTDPIEAAIAATSIDYGPRKIISKMASDAVAGASPVLDKIRGYAGESYTQSEKSTSALHGRDSSEDEDLITPENYPPGKLAEYVEAARQSDPYVWMDTVVLKWLRFWHTRQQGLNALQSLDEVDNRGIYTGCFDEAYSISRTVEGKEKAYQWLVRAHRDRNGWSRYFASKEEALTRWTIILNEYPSRWMDFIKDTVGVDGTGSGRYLLLGSTSCVYLTSYLMIMGQKKLALDVASQIVSSSMEMVSPLPLAVPEWIGQ